MSMGRTKRAEPAVLYCAALQYLTLVFIGGISVTSLRGFMKQMQRFFR